MSCIYLAIYGQDMTLFSLRQSQEKIERVPNQDVRSGPTPVRIFAAFLSTTFCIKWQPLQPVPFPFLLGRGVSTSMTQQIRIGPPTRTRKSGAFRISVPCGQP